MIWTWGGKWYGDTEEEEEVSISRGGGGGGGGEGVGGGIPEKPCSREGRRRGGESPSHPPSYQAWIV